MAHEIPPILKDFPDRFETERLLIRCPLPGDGRKIMPPFWNRSKI